LLTASSKPLLRFSIKTALLGLVLSKESKEKFKQINAAQRDSSLVEKYF